MQVMTRTRVVRYHLSLWLGIGFLLSGSISGCKEARRVSLNSGSGGEQAGTEGGASAGTTSGTTAGTTAGTDVPGGMVNPPYASVKPSLKIKNHRVLEADLSAVLDLEPEELCNELGVASCLNLVHRVTLGGVAPYTQSVYQPSEVSSVSAPSALERVVYSACGLRILRDFNPEEARDGIFGNLPLSQGGRLTDPQGSEVREAITALINRALLRDPSETEIEELIGLYEQLEMAGTQLPGPSWAWGACFAVLTSVEFLFY